MIRLTDVTKIYKTAERKTAALSGINLEFRKSEFVSILGPSGCGKTTLLNIIGGLDKYTGGNLTFNGKSTKTFSDGEWDTYRNSTVGFVFQNYNLISHQNVLSNVEMALSLSGVNSEEKRRRAIEALVRVGLEEHLRKKPSELSGGEMQRVAIARAIVNNPSVILADEPTGALDSKNSLQIMNLLKDISKDRLVITVTHNEELAAKYSTRIIKLKDGKVISDGNPYKSSDEGNLNAIKARKSSMPLSVALKLSLKNLTAKKFRTGLTGIACSVAVIGIALVLSFQNGLNIFVDKLQWDTMSSIPLTVASTATDYSVYADMIFSSVNSAGSESSGNIISESVLKDKFTLYVKHNLSAMTESTTVKNYITENYIDYVKKIDKSKTDYNLIYNIKKNIYKSVILNDAGVNRSVNALTYNASSWNQLPSDKSIVLKQYDLYGKYPESSNELMLVTGKNSTVSDTMLTTYFLDIYSNGKDSYSFDEFLSGGYSNYNLALNNDYYAEGVNGYYTENKQNIADYMVDNYHSTLSDIAKNGIKNEINGALGTYADKIYAYTGNTENSIPLKIVGILTLKEDTTYGMFASSPIVYTSGLTDLIKAQAGGGICNGVTYGESDILKAQKSDFTKNILTKTSETDNPKNNANLLKNLGWAEVPNTVYFYPYTFSDKEYVKNYLDAYNEGKTEDEEINYVDSVGVVLGLVKVLIDGITKVLLILTSVSLFVSAIMTAILSYVSVLERTKEIGILRSIGARKIDIVRLFNSESVLLGGGAGILGIILTLIIEIPLNAFLKKATTIGGLAVLSWYHALLIIILSAVLTVLAGLIPAMMAGKRDPVKALRSE